MADNTKTPEAIAAAAALTLAQRLDQIDALLTEQEKAIRTAFREFISSVQSEAAITAVMERINARDFAGAMQIIDSYIVRMANVIPRVFVTVGEATVTEMTALAREAAAHMPALPPPPSYPLLTAPAAPTLPPATTIAPPPVPPEPALAISFDPSNPRAATLMREQVQEFIARFSEQQKTATAQALQRALPTLEASQLDGSHARSVARAIRDSIGLTPEQEAAVANYEASLRNRSRVALERALRDKRYDGRVERAIANNKPLTEKQIETMVDRYRKNTLQQRAETIALTEGQTAASSARDESLAQMIEQTGLDPAAIEETWHTSRDERVRDSHRSMQGQKQPYGTPFISGLGNKLRRPGDPAAPAADRIRCRCSKSWAIRAD